MEKFSIYLTFDIDQDFDPNSADYYNRSAAKFDSFGSGFQRIIDILDGKAFSVFVRSDYQVGKVYGDYGHLIKSNPSLIKSIKQHNGEINWHIHLYKERGDEWVPVSEDDLVESFNRDLLNVKRIPEINWRILRIGECVMTNPLMEAINNSGILVDSTALPGRVRNDAEKKLDWEITGNKPYHPSFEDYRITGEPSMNVLEVPLVTIPMKASYDKESISRYVNLSFKTEVLFQNMAEYVRNNDSLLSITHPFEVLSPGQHGLIAYDIEVFKKNIQEIDAVVRKCGKEPVYKHVSELL